MLLTPQTAISRTLDSATIEVRAPGADATGVQRTTLPLNTGAAWVANIETAIASVLATKYGVTMTVTAP